MTVLQFLHIFFHNWQNHKSDVFNIKVNFTTYNKNHSYNFDVNHVTFKDVWSSTQYHDIRHFLTFCITKSDICLFRGPLFIKLLLDHFLHLCVPDKIQPSRSTVWQDIPFLLMFIRLALQMLHSTFKIQLKLSVKILVQTWTIMTCCTICKCTLQEGTGNIYSN